jgi:phosphoribosyl 1,2-cyclic phosphodiesterase
LIGVKVSFFGVRGSTPCCSPTVARFGGNTACVVLQPDDGLPIICDLGTGLRWFGCEWVARTDEPFVGTALVSHLHWDHVQGLPFFAPVLLSGSKMTAYGPRQDNGQTLSGAIDDFMKPPYFPVRLSQLPGQVQFVECPDVAFEVSGARILGREIPHCGPTLGYRIEADGVVIAYLPDHQQPVDGSYLVAESVLELCANADLVIHDAQFTEAEFVKKSTWGHCTIGYAVEVAARAGAKRLALFHHDPSHSDDQMDVLAAKAVELGRAAGVEVFAAMEGQRVTVSSARYARLA